VLQVLAAIFGISLLVIVGRLTFLAYELVTHRKPSAKFEALVHATGMLALLTLVALVTWRDLIG
jgi:membrane-associated protease RseP (regulator of RpoE activity)